MDQRPISKRLRQWLTDELTVWRSDGLVSEEQSGRIVALYETVAESETRRRSQAAFALFGIAALMVALAVLLLVGYNWQEMSTPLKLAVIFGSVTVLHGAGFGLRFSWNRPLTSEVVFFLACSLYGAGIWLIAQIFHIQSHYPDGIWFWALGVLPFALASRTPLLHAAYAGLLALWVGTEILGMPGSGGLWIHRWGLSFVPRAAWTLPLMAAPGLWWAYRTRSVAAAGLYASLLTWWAVLQPVAWQWQVSPIYFVGLAGALLLLAAEMHREDSPMASPYRICGVLLTAGVLTVLSFCDYPRGLNVRERAMDYYVAGLVIALIGATAAAVVVVLQQRRVPDGIRGKLPFAGILSRQWLPASTIVLLAGLCFWSGLWGADAYRPSWGGRMESLWTPQVLVPMACVNALIVATALWLMRMGMREDRGGLFTAGVLYFLLWALLRYVDLFAGAGGMLGAAVMFLLCGVGLYAVARLWYHRKEACRD